MRRGNLTRIYPREAGDVDENGDDHGHKPIKPMNHDHGSKLLTTASVWELQAASLRRQGTSAYTPLFAAPRRIELTEAL